MYSIPLRRALVTNSPLPYPEGVACAEVLKVGHASDGGEGNRQGLVAIVTGAAVSAGFSIVVAMQLFAANLAQYFRLPGEQGKTGATGYDLNFSFALLAVGHLVGLWVGLAILAGAAIAWLGFVPFLTQVTDGAAEAVALTAWSKKVRFVGAGCIAVAAVWTLVKLARPVVAGLHSAAMSARVRKAGKADTLPRNERDIPIGTVGLITLACMLPIAFMLSRFATDAGLGEQLGLLVAGGVVYVVLMSFFVAAVCGYMAGLIGSSNSPLSGVGILVVIGVSLLLALVVKPLLPPTTGQALVAFALFVTAVVFAVATISNDNLQDLKTGQLVDATPWRQQVALIIGVVAGAIVIPPVLDLLNKAYGFAGVPGADPKTALAAPQAALISALAKGVIQGDLNWNLIGIGAAIGVACILVDEALKRGSGGKAHLAPLAVGLGIYLPLNSTLTIVVGAVAGWWFERRASHQRDPEAAKQLGVLMASGLIVGESLLGVILAGVVVFSGNGAPLAVVGESFATTAQVLGFVAFAGVGFGLYRWLLKRNG
jgi:putative OPT family oligopeptide transporter